MTKILLSSAAFLAAMLALGIQIAGWRRDRRERRAVARLVSHIGRPTNRAKMQECDPVWMSRNFYCPPHRIMGGGNCGSKIGCSCAECWRGWLDEEARP